MAKPRKSIPHHGAEAYRTAYITSVNEMAKMLAVDGEDDPDLVYSREVIDRRIRSIVGEEKFVPWDIRYRGGHR